MTAYANTGLLIDAASKIVSTSTGVFASLSLTPNPRRHTVFASLTIAPDSPGTIFSRISRRSCHSSSPTSFAHARSESEAELCAVFPAKVRTGRARRARLLSDRNSRLLIVGNYSFTFYRILAWPSRGELGFRFISSHRGNQ